MTDATRFALTFTAGVAVGYFLLDWLTVGLIVGVFYLLIPIVIGGSWLLEWLIG